MLRRMLVMPIVYGLLVLFAACAQPGSLATRTPLPASPTATHTSAPPTQTATEPAPTNTAAALTESPT